MTEDREDRHGPEVVALLDLALIAITQADTLDMARGLAHAALHREEYHGHEAVQ